MVYVLRDGRDALASYYDYALRRSEFSGSFPEFVASRLKDPWVGFGPWPDHVRHWLLGTRSRPTLRLRFEDLYRKPELEVQGLVSFLGLHCDDVVIAEAILRAREYFEAEGLNPRPARFRGLGEGPGSWQKRFTPELADLFWERAGDVMLKMGYTRT